MKKTIITTAIMLSASLSFYAKQISAVSTVKFLKADNLKKDFDFGLKFNNNNRMDIGQADIK